MVRIMTRNMVTGEEINEEHEELRVFRIQHSQWKYGAHTEYKKDVRPHKKIRD